MARITRSKTFHPSKTRAETTTLKPSQVVNIRLSINITLKCHIQHKKAVCSKCNKEFGKNQEDPPRIIMYINWLGDVKINQQTNLELHDWQKGSNSKYVKRFRTK